MIRHVFELLIAWATGWWGLFGLCATAGILNPVPEDLVLVWAGIQVEQGALALAPALGVTIAGVYVRDLVVFLLGRLVGEWLLAHRWTLRLLGAHRVARAIRLVENHGTAAVVIGRGLVGMRTPVFLAAGAAGVGFRRFAVLDGLGVLITVPLVIGVGWAVGSPAIDAIFWVARSARALFYVGAFVGIVWFVRGWLRRRRAGIEREDDWSGEAEGGVIADHPPA